jgi:uridine kinase
MALFNEHLRGLADGIEVETPVFDFKTGNRVKGQTVPFRIQKDEIILVDCLHGLHPELTAGIKEEEKFNLYLETLSQQRDKSGYFVRWADLRLLRRMIRDKQFRNYSPEQTINHWHYTRRGEVQFIFPYMKTVDHIANGALAYELPIHKALWGDFFSKYVEKNKSNPDRADAVLRAERIDRLFQELVPATKEEIDTVSKISPLREFIGGSSYKY